MLKCREVVADADRLLAGELTLQRRLALRMHLLMCRYCRRYIRQLRMLLNAIPTMHEQASEREVTEVMNSIQASDSASSPAKR